MIPKDVLLLPASPERRASSSTGNGKVREDFGEPFHCRSLYSSKAHTKKQSLEERGTQKCSLPAVFPLASYFFLRPPYFLLFLRGREEGSKCIGGEGGPACLRGGGAGGKRRQQSCLRESCFVCRSPPPSTFVRVCPQLSAAYPTAGGGGRRISRSPQRPPPPPLLPPPPPPRPPPPPPPPRCYFCCCCCGVRSFSFASRRMRIRRRRRRREGPLMAPHFRRVVDLAIIIM